MATTNENAFNSRSTDRGNTTNVQLRYKYDQTTPAVASSTRMKTTVDSAYHTKRHQHSNFLTGAHAAAAVNNARERKKVSQLDDLFDFDP